MGFIVFNRYTNSSNNCTVNQMDIKFNFLLLGTETVSVFLYFTQWSSEHADIHIFVPTVSSWFKFLQTE